MKKNLLLLLVLFAIPAMLSADTWSSTADVGNPAPAGVTYPAGPGGLVGGIGGALIPSFSGPTTISVTDCCAVGDVYEVLVGGTSLGLTSLEPIGGSTLSSGMWTVPDASAGIDIWDITLSYIGAPSPFGGGDVPSYYTPAGLTVTATATPEPCSLLLLGAGLAGVVYKLKRENS